MGKTHPKIPIFVKVPVFVEKVGLQHESQRPVDGNGVEKHAERVGADAEAVRVEIMAHVIGKTGTHQHHRVVFFDMERILRSRDNCSKLHILLFGYQ